MTPFEKANELYVRFSEHTNEETPHTSAIDSVRICIDEIELALTNYGEDSMQLQNMDSEFRYWSKVREAVESF